MGPSTERNAAVVQHPSLVVNLLEAPPDGWFNLLEGHLQLIDVTDAG